jgi:sterol desaturase/sphingolipid hydroxylase (fatty acid hydroxylase superfamily)
MGLWTDNRNHLLDSILTDSIFVLVARLIGVAPGQFVLLVAVSQLIESLGHANLRLGFGWLGERLLVGPYFHRLHHAIGLGHEFQGRGTLGGCNFAVLLPVWDILFGTANFSHQMQATGVRDQLPEEGGRNYGKGFWSQQRLGILRLFRRA